jgi:hypothetical protein
VAARSKAWVCGPRLLGLRLRIPPGDGCLSLVTVVCCQVEVFATGRFLVQKSPTECACVCLCVCVYVCVCMSLSAIKCKNNNVHLQ